MPEMSLDEIILGLKEEQQWHDGRRGDQIREAITSLERLKLLLEEKRFENHKIVHFLKDGEWLWGWEGVVK